jgi:hypothetical protein
MTRLAILCPLAAALVFASAMPKASAQSSASEKAAAEALFDEGKKLMIQGQYTEACDKLEQSQRIDPGIGTLLYLAECYEKGGRSASAWATFREATSAARAAGQLDRARAGQQRADRLEPTLSRLTITVAPENSSLTGFEVRRGSESVTRALWNTPVPVDPGEHVVEARAPGRKPFSQTVQVGSQAARATLSIPMLEIDPEASVAAPPEGSAAPPPAAESAPPATTPAGPSGDQGLDDGSQQRTIGIILGGVGVVGLGVGTIFGLRAISKNSDAEDLCPKGNECYAGAESLTDEAKDAATLSNIGFGLGALALAGGAVLYLTAPRAAGSEASTARRLRVAPLATRQGGALFVGGSF